jgi:hypothetical protein
MRLAIVVLSILLAGCGSEGPTRLTFPVAVAPSAAQGLANDYGYTISLSRAALRLEALHFFSGEPLFARGPSRLERLWRATFGLGVAHAHPGHYQEGEALAELFSPSTVDLLAGAALGDASGVTGRYRSAGLMLGSDAAIGGSVALEGKAAKAGGAEVAFTGKLTVTEKIVGIAAGEAEVAPPIQVTLKVDLARYLQRVDFAALTGTGTVAIPAGSQAENALGRGVANTSAYGFAWSAR